MVTGVAAILKSIRSSLMPPILKEILARTADPITTVAAGESVTEKPLGTLCFSEPDIVNRISTMRGCRLNTLKATQALSF